MSRIVVRRTAPEDIKMRDLYLVIDDTRERTLLYGDTLEVEAEPGEHRIKATNRLFTKHIDFRLEPGETAIFSAANVGVGCMGALMLLGGTGGYRVTLAQVDD